MGCQFAAEDKSAQPNKLSQRPKKSKLIDSRRLSTKFMDIITENITIIREQLEQPQKIFALKCLQSHQFFSTLKEEQLSEIVKYIVIGQAQKFTYVFNQGDPGSSFFIIYKGQVEVQVDGLHARTLAQGQSFGQIALLFKTERTASIKCTGDINQFLIIKPALFRQSLKKMKIHEFQKNRKIIDSIQIFQGLTNKQKQSLSRNLKPINFRKDQIIFREGDPATSFYIITNGQIKIEITNKEPICLKIFESFGQGAFHQEVQRTGTATAVTEVTCVFLKTKDLNLIFGKNFNNIFFYNLKKWALLRSEHFRLDIHTINALLAQFQIRKAQQGQILVQSMPSGLIINLEGLINGKPAGTLFCERTYIDRTAQTSPIIKNDSGYYAYLSYEKIDKIFGQIQEKKSIKNYSKKTLPLDKQNSELFNLAKFQFLKQLGQGQFGKVYLVKNNGFGGNLYAVKCLSKQQIKKQAMQKCVIQQKKILSKTVFPYIVGFAQAFHDEKNIYFMMEYIKGKEMFDVIRQMPFLNKKIATYFFGCLLLAVQHLHEHNIIYRDLKPENSVVDYTGKVFLIDMGTAKILKKDSFYRTFTMIGTPHYMAPEILDGKGYSFEVDIWSLGILLYEFVCGCLPFGENDNDPYIVMKKVRLDQIKYPKSANVESTLKDLLALLLQKNPKVRSLKATFQEIKNSGYFQDLDWSELLHENLVPPYIPKDFRKQREHENTLKIDGKPFGQFLYGKGQKSKQWKVKQWNQQFK